MEVCFTTPWSTPLRSETEEHSLREHKLMDAVLNRSLEMFPLLARSARLLRRQHQRRG